MLERIRDGYFVNSSLETIEFEAVYEEIADQDYRDRAALTRLRKTFEPENP